MTPHIQDVDHDAVRKAIGRRSAFGGENSAYLLGSRDLTPPQRADAHHVRSRRQRL
jgi:hypothetical protein